MTLYVVSRKRVKMVFYLYEQQNDRYSEVRTSVAKFETDNAFNNLTTWIDGFLYKKYSPDYDKTLGLIHNHPSIDDKFKIHMMNLSLKEWGLYISDENLIEGKENK